MLAKHAVSKILFLLAVGYAIFRYHIIKGVPWEHFPLFIFNKGISLAAVFTIATSYLLGPLSRFFPRLFTSWLGMRKYLGVFGFGLAAVHVLISLLILNPSYFPKFYDEGGKLNLVGELSLLFGVVSFFIFSIIAISSMPSVEDALDKNKWQQIQRLGYLAFTLTMLHVLVMGLAGWLKTQDWPGGLLPVSLVAFIVIFLTLLIRLAVLMLPKNKS